MRRMRPRPLPYRRSLQFELLALLPRGSLWQRRQRPRYPHQLRRQRSRLQRTYARLDPATRMNTDPNCLTWLEGPDRSLERGPPRSDTRTRVDNGNANWTSLPNDDLKLIVRGRAKSRRSYCAARWEATGSHLWPVGRIAPIIPPIRAPNGGAMIKAAIPDPQPSE
jgi:hypothetical protein